MKRFYKDVSLNSADGGFTIALDGKGVKTPAGKPLTISAEPLANAVAGEWRGQKEKVDLKTMPLTTLSYAAIDQVAENRALIEGEVAAFAGSDLICYRADAPIELRKKEQAAWDPIVAWLTDEYALELIIINGISHVAQADKTLTFMASLLAEQNDFSLAAMQRITGLLGSVFLGVAVAEQKLSPDEAWAASRVDEMYQAELWGEDAEAAVELKAKHAQFCATVEFITLLRA